jgi:hypothetical protein
MNLQEAVCPFIIMSHLILFKKEMLHPVFAEEIKTHILH